VRECHDRDDAPVAWREAGDAALPVALFLHGLGGSRIAWEPQLTALSGVRRCVAWDAPGYGASKPGPEPLTFDALADAAAGLLDRLEAETADVVGMSFGGMIAQYLALRHPGRVRTLALISTSPKFGLDGTQPEEWRAARLAPLDAGVEPKDMTRGVLTSLAAPGAEPAAVDSAVRAMARVPATGLRAAIDCLVTHDTRGRLKDIHGPTLVMVGERDAETPVAYASALAAGIPGARLTVIPGAGHLLNVEAPDAVNAALLDLWGATDK
jgi:pimeloyl-ACP methyl ester carboxylesterase